MYSAIKHRCGHRVVIPRTLSLEHPLPICIWLSAESCLFKVENEDGNEVVFWSQNFLSGVGFIEGIVWERGDDLKGNKDFWNELLFKMRWCRGLESRICCAREKKCLQQHPAPQFAPSTCKRFQPSSLPLIGTIRLKRFFEEDNRWLHHHRPVQRLYKYEKSHDEDGKQDKGPRVLGLDKKTLLRDVDETGKSIYEGPEAIGWLE